MRDKSLATATASVLAAFAVAHLMQFGLTAGRALSDDTRAGADVRATPPVPQDQPSQALARPPRAEGRVTEGPALRPTSSQDALNRFGQLCRRALLATAEPDGLLRVRIDAPCDPEVRVELRHGGLRFAVSTGPAGSREVVIPALTVAADVAMQFADGSSVSTSAQVPGAGGIWRLAVVTEGDAGISLQTGSVDVHRLGDPGVSAPIRTEVHTLAAGRLGPLYGATPRLEVVVSPRNCARDMAAEVIRAGPDRAPERMTLRLAMPDCGIIGDLVTLDLPMPEARLARN